MHVCHITRVIWEHGIHGGMERHSRLIVDGLRARGHRVTTVTTHCPEAPTGTVTVPGTRPARYTPGWWRQAPRAVAAVHARDPIDVVWSQSAGGRSVIIHGRTGVPAVVTLHGTLATEWRSRRLSADSPRGVAALLRSAVQFPLEDWRWRRALPRCAHVIAVSRQVAASAAATWGLPADRLTVIPNGIEVDRFRPDPSRRAAERAALGIPPEAPVLLTAGRLSRGKGNHLALEAVAALDAPVHLVIAGDGAEAAALRRQAARSAAADRIRFTGFIPTDRLAALMQAADIFLLPSVREEGLPMVLLEAMASGLPIVAAASGGIPSAVAHEHEGLLHPVGDVAALTAAVRRVVQSADFASALGRAARARAVADFSVDQMVAATAAVLRRVRTTNGANAV